MSKNKQQRTGWGWGAGKDSFTVLLPWHIWHWFLGKQISSRAEWLCSLHRWWGRQSQFLHLFRWCWGLLVEARENKRPFLWKAHAIYINICCCLVSSQTTASSVSSNDTPRSQADISPRLACQISFYLEMYRLNPRPSAHKVRALPLSYSPFLKGRGKCLAHLTKCTKLWSHKLECAALKENIELWFDAN